MSKDFALMAPSVNEKLKNYLKRLESSSAATSNKLNFEYSFFKRIKSVFYDDSIIASEDDLKSVMFYCLNKSMTQLNLFRNLIIPNCASKDDMDEFDQQDEINMIDL